MDGKTLKFLPQLGLKSFTTIFKLIILNCFFWFLFDFWLAILKKKEYKSILIRIKYILLCGYTEQVVDFRK